MIMPGSVFNFGIGSSYSIYDKFKPSTFVRALCVYTVFGKFFIYLLSSGLNQERSAALLHCRLFCSVVPTVSACEGILTKT